MKLQVDVPQTIPSGFPSSLSLPNVQPRLLYYKLSHKNKRVTDEKCSIAAKNGHLTS